MYIIDTSLIYKYHYNRKRLTHIMKLSATNYKEIISFNEVRLYTLNCQHYVLDYIIC